MKLGYWDLRGRAAPARLMLAYKGVKYEDIRYKIDLSNPTQSKWFQEKDNLGLAFPNLPYLIDGDVKLTETTAINRYLGRKLGLLPSNEAQERDCDMFESILSDMIFDLASSAYSKDMVEKLGETREKQLVKLRMIDSFLSGRDYIAGDRLTYADFRLYEAMDWHRLLYPNIFNALKNIEAFMARFEALVPIAEHIKSEKYKKYPIFAPFATWGGKDYDDRTWERF